MSARRLRAAAWVLAVILSVAGDLGRPIETRFDHRAGRVGQS